MPCEIESVPAADTHAAWWRSVFDASEDAQIICSSDGRVRDLNRRAAQLFGVTNGDACHLSILESLSGPTGKRVVEIFERRKRHAETLSAVTLLSSSGFPRLVIDLVVTPLTSELFLLTIKDAGQRWRMESHTQRLIAALDSTPDVFFLTDAEMRLTFVNSAFQNVTGHTIEEALGRTADFLRAPKQNARISEYLARVQEGEDWAGELINQRADGTLYHVEAVISPIHDRNGRLLGYVACERDLSQKRQLQQELLRERNFANSIINCIDSAIYTMDREFRVTHVNEGWKRFPQQHGWLALRSAPMTGDNFLEYIDGVANAGEIRRHLESVLATQRASEFHVAGPGNKQWLVTISPLTHDNVATGLIYNVTDQTKFHELQNQLYQAQKMETIGSLAAGIAHDFNNLLQVIRGNLTLLSEDKSRAEDERFQHIEEAAVRAAEITDQLLSFSRVSDEKLIVFDFNKIIKEVAQLARRSMRGNINLKVNPARQPLKVRMDANRAHQLLLNLVVNGQDAMPAGGHLSLTSCATRLTPQQAQKCGATTDDLFVRCSVSDTGEGIPAEILHRIFDPFFTTKETGKGTGLGLSIVHNVVRQSGGFLEVTSEVGEGATFDVYLPLVEAELAADAQKPTAAPRRGSGRILVVEDLDLVRDFTQAFLNSAGYEASLASHGAEALEILQREGGAFDLVFTDFNMPGMSGLELIQEIARRHPSMRFILASGYLDEGERQRIVNTTGARILKKPYNVRDATALIHEVLHARP